uniref:Dystrobrevin n=1 Tax=Caenorhabditis japonica TaxID=281687 RepID=A0A8R1DY36_CAEJA
MNLVYRTNGNHWANKQMWPKDRSRTREVSEPSQDAEIPAIQPIVPSEMQQLIDDMRLQDFDSIRFATYRAACKLRFIQQNTKIHLVDIWNMIEAFRENGLNALPLHTVIKTSRAELLLTTVYHNLNKRLVASQHVNTDVSISLLLAFILGAYDKQNTGRLSVFSTKVALTTLCAGKLVDKLRYIFSQIADSQGFMDHIKFADFLQQVLSLTTAVFEAPTFGFSEAVVTQCFNKDEKVTLNVFLDTFLNDPCPPCIMWLPLLHRMAAVDNVYHPVVCDACQVRSFTGFRYKCQRCANYQLCQSCFWRGRTSQNHSNEHEMKEYSSYKSPTKQLVHSVHKSLQCIPIASPGDGNVEAINTTGSVAKLARPLNLVNIVPATPTAIRRKHAAISSADCPTSPVLLPGQASLGGVTNDEHKLIARYAAKLSGRADYPFSNGRSMNSSTIEDERTLIAQLEEENSVMVREMARLESQTTSMDDGLAGLRDKKVELEEKMFEMQQRRRELMMQLEHLIAQLNAPQPTDGVLSASLSQLPLASDQNLTGVHSNVSNAFRAGSLPAASLQSDLLLAADLITTNMSDLVRQLDLAQTNDGDLAVNGI